MEGCGCAARSLDHSEEKQMLFVTHDFFSPSRLSHNFFIFFIFLNCIFPSFDCFFFFSSSESVCIATGDEPARVYGGGYEKHTACIYCTFVIWVCFFCFSFYRQDPEKL